MTSAKKSEFHLLLQEWLFCLSVLNKYLKITQLVAWRDDVDISKWAK